MSDEVDASVIQKTQQTLGKYIQRPQLTDKLLKRPPFRFLHDIITTAIKQYGVFEQVFDRQELVSDNIKEKEAKLAFLQKLINHISSQTGEDLKVKPSKIVAGSEPQRTNELLVALAKLLENKQNNTLSKTKNKAAANNQSQPNGNTSSSPSKVPKTSTKTHDATATTKKTTTETPKPSVPAAGGPKTDSKSKAHANLKAKEVPSKASTATKPSILKSGPKTTEDSIKKRIATNGNKSSPIKTVIKESSPKNSPRIPSQPPAKEIGSLPVSTLKQIEESARSPANKVTVPIPKVEEQPKNNHPVVDNNDNLPTSDNLGSPDSGILMENPKSATPSATETRPHSSTKSSIANRNLSSPSKPAVLEVRHPIPVVPDAVDPLDSPPMGNAVSDSEGKLSPHLAVMRKETFERPLTRAPPPRQHSTTTRPKSSRRPPSRTGRERLTLVRPESRAGGGPAVPHVILDGHSFPTDDEDEEDKIVQAAVLEQNFTDDLSGVIGHVSNNQQSKLVEQILSAQREFVDSDDPSGKDTVVGSQRLKSLIQEVAQAAQPLGHLIPLIHEDLEVMYNEWHAWKREGDRLHEQLERERSSVKSSMDELITELARLDAAIDMQRAKLCAAKASLLRGQGDVALLISNFGKFR